MNKWKSFFSALFILLAGAYLLKLSLDAAVNMPFAQRDYGSSDFISTCADTGVEGRPLFHPSGSVMVKNGRSDTSSLVSP